MVAVIFNWKNPENLNDFSCMMENTLQIQNLHLSTDILAMQQRQHLEIWL